MVGPGWLTPLLRSARLAAAGWAGGGWSAWHGGGVAPAGAGWAGSRAASPQSACAYRYG